MACNGCIGSIPAPVPNGTASSSQPTAKRQKLPIQRARCQADRDDDPADVQCRLWEMEDELEYLRGRHAAEVELASRQLVAEWRIWLVTEALPEGTSNPLRCTLANVQATFAQYGWEEIMCVEWDSFRIVNPSVDDQLEEVNSLVEEHDKWSDRPVDVDRGQSLMVFEEEHLGNIIESLSAAELEQDAAHRLQEIERLHNQVEALTHLPCLLQLVMPQDLLRRMAQFVA